MLRHLWARQNGSSVETAPPNLPNDPNELAAYENYAKIVALHGLVGFAALAVLAPLAILIAAIGKRRWIHIHRKLQFYVVLPLSLVCVTLAYAASIAAPNPTPLDSHKVLGMVLFASVLGQVATGDYAFTKYFSLKPRLRSNTDDAPAAIKPKKKMSLKLHASGGIGFLVSPAMQVMSGLREWQSHVGAPLPFYVVPIVWVAFISFPSILLLHWIGASLLRMRRGSSFRTAFFHSSVKTLSDSAASSKEEEADGDVEHARLLARGGDVEANIDDDNKPPRSSRPPRFDFDQHLPRRTLDSGGLPSPRSVSSPAAPSYSFVVNSTNHLLPDSPSPAPSSTTATISSSTRSASPLPSNPLASSRTRANAVRPLPTPLATTAPKKDSAPWSSKAASRPLPAALIPGGGSGGYKENQHPAPRGRIE
ncbi:hypothetical protein JCM1841_000360 [Sporobolomyces salmonicolor]